MKEIRLNGYTTSPDICIRKNADGTDTRTIEGYAIVFGQESLPLWREKDTDIVEVIDRDAVSLSLLDAADIKMTMYHDMGRIIGRSKRGKGTLSYEIDDRGVRFSVDVPRTAYGDEALELVKRGDVDGCSFMFTTVYNDRTHVAKEPGEGKTVMRVKKITGIYDFTLTPDPAYPQTECAARSHAIEQQDPQSVPEQAAPDETWREQIKDMRQNAKY